MLQVNKTATELIDELMNHWACWDEHEEFYLTVLAPRLIENPLYGDDLEKSILSTLRSLLNEPEWNKLPLTISEKRKEIRRENEKNRLRGEFLNEINRIFATNFLSATDFFYKNCSEVLTEYDFKQAKFSFVKNWFMQNQPKQIPDDEQIAAISAVNGHVQVIARAGSGKTSTLVNRVLFLLKHCHIAPEEILILAFNRKAALEIRRRLLVLLDQNAEPEITATLDRRSKDEKQKQRQNKVEIEANAVDAIASKLKIVLPHVMTFHALAYAIVHPEESLLYNGAEGEAQGLSRAFQQVIDDHVWEPGFQAKIRELMLAHFRSDQGRIFEERYFQSKEDFLRSRRSLPRETLRGEYVKSYGEKIIADFLFEHDIAYKYEQNHWWSGINYRPDFTIAFTRTSGLIIEYFGLTGDPDYDEMSVNKREYWKSKPGWTLIELTPNDIAQKGSTAFLEMLKTTLMGQDVQCKRLSEDEIWNRVRVRAIDRFTTATVGFVGRCRKLVLSPVELLDKIKSYSPESPVEGMFLDLAYPLYVAYLNRLSATGEEDFDGLMQRAAESVEAGETCFLRKSGGGNLSSLRHICIDEFQDFSNLFYRLLIAIKTAAPKVELFCVGDDWQAINGFAGSDLRFFNEFENYIGKANRLYISTNYRSKKSIVSIGNALMTGLGNPASASKSDHGTVLISDLDYFEPTHIEKQRHNDDVITPAVLRVIDKSLDANKNVVMLCRRNGLPWYINYGKQQSDRGRNLEGYLELIQSFFPYNLRERITISTAHKYKGLEQSTVIVLDLVVRSYPLIHPDWQFFKIFGDTVKKITDEERRLLYVALTRATDTLVVITEGRNKSPFLEDLECTTDLAPVKWADYPTIRGQTTCWHVKICNQHRRGTAPTFAIKNLLKASGYNWRTNTWAKSFPSEGFTIETLKSEIWAQPANGVEVQIFDDTDTPVARYLIDAGNWKCIDDKLHEVRP